MLSKYSETGTEPDGSAAAALDKGADDSGTPKDSEGGDAFDVPEGFPGEVGDKITVEIVEGPDGQRQFEPVDAPKDKSWSKANLQKEMA